MYPSSLKPNIPIRRATTIVRIKGMIKTIRMVLRWFYIPTSWLIQELLYLGSKGSNVLVHF